MKRIKQTLLTTTMIFGAFFAQKSNAQVGPCGFDITSVVNQPTCNKVCDGSISVAPTVNWPDFEYLWSNGSTSDMIMDLCEDEFTVTVTDDKKCSQSYTFSIIDPAPVVANCTTLTNESAPGAADGSIEASAIGGTGNYTFEWQTNPIVTGEEISGLSAGSYTVIVYDGNDCTATTTCDITTEKKEECVGFRTQTMGGWGQCHQNGSNPGTYLFANFAGAFNNGLTIGCGSRTLKLTSAQAVCEFLPSGTGPKVLPLNANIIDPGQTYSNVFAGQLVTAMINATFDATYADFASNSDFTLGELVITSGTFVDWTVDELIAEANRKIGGCASVYSPSALSNALKMVNENFTGGLVDNGFLACPDDKKKEEKLASNLLSDISVNVYPNPVNLVSNISVFSAADQKIAVEVYNVAGQKVATLFNSNVKSGEFTTVKFDSSNLNNGIYFIKTVSEGEVINQKVIVSK